jgi:CheY-like chemotaxis protein
MERKKILLVDDSKTAIFMEQTLLKKSGIYDLVTASDGAEGVSKASAELPDLILMDMVMPHMTGLEAARALRQREDTKHIPIIMVTTRGEAENVAAGRDSGCNDYVTKPIDGPVLLAKIRTLLGG